MSKPRHVGQKIALVTAVFCALMMLPALAGFVWVWSDKGLADTWTPSLLATIVFFGCCAAVLYSMSRPQVALPAGEASSVEP